MAKNDVASERLTDDELKTIRTNWQGGQAAVVKDLFRVLDEVERLQRRMKSASNEINNAIDKGPTLDIALNLTQARDYLEDC